MRQVGGDPDLAQEPLATQRGRQVGAQHLHRHLALVAHVVGQVDGSHATVTEFAFDFVAPGERGFQVVETIRHGG